MITQDERDLRDQLVDYESEIKQGCDWARMDAACQRSGQEKKLWTGDFKLPRIGETVIVWPGCCTGIVADYAIAEVDGVYERAVWVWLNSSEFIKYTGRECKPVNEKDIEYINEQNAEFSKRLVAAGKKVERQRKERRQRQVKGSHLLDDMLAAAKDLTVDEKSSFYKITGSVKGKTVYIAIKGGRVDLSGFCIEHEAVISLTEEEARRRHLGKVRGQLNFDKGDALAMEAYRCALVVLSG